MNALNILVVAILILACGVLDLLIGRYKPAGALICIGAAIATISGVFWAESLIS